MNYHTSRRRHGRLELLRELRNLKATTHAGLSGAPSEDAIERTTRGGDRLATSIHQRWIQKPSSGHAERAALRSWFANGKHKALERNRTADHILTMDVLYRLSYKGIVILRCPENITA